MVLSRTGQIVKVSVYLSWRISRIYYLKSTFCINMNKGVICFVKAYLDANDTF